MALTNDGPRAFSGSPTAAVCVDCPLPATIFLTYSAYPSIGDLCCEVHATWRGLHALTRRHAIPAGLTIEPMWEADLAA